MTPWIDELERDLGQAARLRLIVNAGGQRRSIPHPANAAESALAQELGVAVAIWLAERFAGTQLDFPTRRGMTAERRAALLRAAILDAGLTNPTRSANDLAAEHGVSLVWVTRLRNQMRAEAEHQPRLPLFE